jgi:hypothetical protein
MVIEPDSPTALVIEPDNSDGEKSLLMSQMNLTTWSAPTVGRIVEALQYVWVRVRGGAASERQEHPWGYWTPRAIVGGMLPLVETSRLPGRAYESTVLWAWRAGPATLHLAVRWRA